MILFVFATTILAGRFSDFSHAKGYHPDLKERVEGNRKRNHPGYGHGHGYGNGTEGFRFLNKRTKGEFLGHHNMGTGRGLVKNGGLGGWDVALGGENRS